MNTFRLTSFLRSIGPAILVFFASQSNADHFACSNDVANLVGSVVRTDDAGNILDSFGQGILVYPISLAFDRNGVLYVGDYQTGTVERFLPDGTYLGEFTNVHDVIGSIVFHPDGSLLVARYEGGTVWRFAPDGTPMTDFVSGNALTRHGQMVFDSSGDMYLSSWTESTIYRYDSTGNFLGVFSDFAKSGISGVLGMAFDTAGRMYISEYSSHQLKLLDADGFILQNVATSFGEPEFLTMGEDGNLFVPHFFNNTVHRFAPDGTDLGEFAPVLGTYQIARGPLFIVPESVSVLRGRVDTGDVDSLAADDGNVFRVCKFLVLNSSEPPIQVNVKSTSSMTDPNTLTAFMTSQMATNGLFRQELIMIDRNGNLSPTVRRADNLDTVEKTVSLSADVPSDFIAGDGSVRIRYNIRPIGPGASSIWCHEADQVSWTIVP